MPGCPRVLRIALSCLLLAALTLWGGLLDPAGADEGPPQPAASTSVAPKADGGWAVNMLVSEMLAYIMPPSARRR